MSEANQQSPFVALIGNPNAGKTTLFNSLTGAFQKVGNYPGVTVETVKGKISHKDLKADLVDLPGLYSTSAVSEDEKVAVDVLLGSQQNERRPDVLVYVLDATNLERNLFLLTQIAEFQIPTVIALTMTDVAKGKGVSIDIDKLRSEIGVPVVKVVAHKNFGKTELCEAIFEQLTNRFPIRVDVRGDKLLEEKVDLLKERLSRSGFDYERSVLRSALIRGCSDLMNDIREYREISELFVELHDSIRKEGITDDKPSSKWRFEWASNVAKLVQNAEGRKKSVSDKIDFVLTHRIFGLVIFMTVMYIVFQSIYTFSGPLMDQIENLFSITAQKVSPYLDNYPVIQSAIVDGLISGLASMLVFLPQILILFLFIAILEGSGYLARAAFLMDKLLGWCGLNGRAFIPLLASFACAIPGIMAARVMPDAKSRLATILVAPLMSCSARLPVYVLLIGAFIQPRFGSAWAGFTLFAMHFLGLLVAIPIVLIINTKIIRGKKIPFLLELPAYQWPKWRDVWLAVYFRGKVFVSVAGKMIVLMSILIWALLYFPRSNSDELNYTNEYQQMEIEKRNLISLNNYIIQRQTESSYLGRFGKFIEPVFVPAGFDWRISTSILAAFPAREVVVPSMGIIFSLGNEQDEASIDLRNALESAKWPDGKPLFTPWTAVGLMVFFALCAQCMATLATVKRETGTWKWPLFMFVYMTMLAWLGAVFVNVISKQFG